MARESSADVLDMVRHARSDPRVWEFVQSHPWPASLSARRALAQSRCDDVAWAVLGLAQSLLGNHQYAVYAYRHARQLAPDNPWYAHNLGHLLDIAFDDPSGATPHLAYAYETLCDSAEPTDTPEMGDRREVVTSYAHALWRSGRLDEARQLMLPLVRGQATRDEHDLYAAILEQHERIVEAHLNSLDLTEAVSPGVATRRIVRRRSTQ